MDGVIRYGGSARSIRVCVLLFLSPVVMEGSRWDMVCQARLGLAAERTLNGWAGRIVLNMIVLLRRLLKVLYNVG